MTNKGIYVHIPFCKSKCNYCDFVSFPVSDTVTVQKYIEYLKKEILLYSSKYKKKYFTSIYFGGGTPSILNAEQLQEILDCILYKFNYLYSPEISIETNPDNLNSSFTQNLREIGFNRISIGVQNNTDTMLSKMGRNYNADDIYKALSNVKKAGFKNINIDLMYGLPGQKLSCWLDILKEFANFDITHISAYQLKLEEDTPWKTLYDKGELHLPDEEETYQMYIRGSELLQKKGFRHYEISNWAQKGYECSHNKVYWLNNDYLGLGLNSSSHIEGYRFKNSSNLNDYIKKLQNNEYPFADKFKLSTEEQMAETMIMGLRLREGIDRHNFKKRFDVFPEEVYEEQIKKLTHLGLLKTSQDKIFLTPKGFPLANNAMIEFL